MSKLHQKHLFLDRFWGRFWEVLTRKSFIVRVCVLGSSIWAIKTQKQVPNKSTVNTINLTFICRISTFWCYWFLGHGRTAGLRSTSEFLGVFGQKCLFVYFWKFHYINFLVGWSNSLPQLPPNQKLKVFDRFEVRLA